MKISLSFLRLLLAVFLALILSACEDQKNKIKIVKQITQKVAKTVLPKLMKTLKKKVKQTGYSNSLQFCSSFAPAATAASEKDLYKSLERKYGIASLNIRRISNRYRNPANKPSKRQQAVLKDWQEAIDNGADAQLTIYQSGSSYIGMQPIRIKKKLCLGCHGPIKKLDEQVQKKLKKLYPNDKATGYKLKQLRGALAVTVQL